MKQAELIFDAKATLGEGPCWLSESNKLIWVDINGYSVNLFDPATGTNQSHDIGQYVGAAVVREKGGLLLALYHGFYFYDLETKQLTAVGDPESDIETNRFNDGKCDPEGRFWAGTMVLDGEPGDANLYRMNKDLNVERLISGVTISNGMAWNIEKETMYYIDTPTKKIRSYDFLMKTGEITNHQTAITISEGMGSPDGMTIDEEGMLWVAFFGGWKVIRFDPETGESLTEISVPASQVTSCAFGGEQLNELYITTARIGLSDEELEKQPHAGGVFRVKLDIKGAPSYQFKG
ncbi:SMP-30/gluconolactonase/LRE family protein [Salipaludibacillus sp. HK11]|uniref:SMP-30/gluconolactonase/LRE family protein n=1 Tax=Salipaludibacillus sp. HK11 TaxID=3394320 RepID=UPI0039FCA69C